MRCGTEKRRSDVNDDPNLNGIDYLEIHTPDLTDDYYPNPLLIVHCFKPLGVNEGNVIILGGVRIKNISAEWTSKATDLDGKKISNKQKGQIRNNNDCLEKILVIRPTSPGDFSTYDLRIVKSIEQPEIPADTFDNILYRIDFSFKVECPSEFDCACSQVQEETFVEPAIDYMAKDYSSFRRLVFDRLSLIMPDWKERNVSDMGVMLVEVLSYVGDQLSYYQDAVGTEMYLGTARLRVSAKRHARLLNYNVWDGCNARAWVWINASSDGAVLPKKTILLTSTEQDTQTIIYGDSVENEILKGSEVFETMHDLTLYSNKNEIPFYTWGETECWLPKGSVGATLEHDSVMAFVWENVSSSNAVELVSFLKNNILHDLTDKAKIDTVDIDTARLIDPRPEITISYNNKVMIITRDDKKASLSINGDLVHEFDVLIKPDGNHELHSSTVQVGDVLVFEYTGLGLDSRVSDPSFNHAVRLASVVIKTDKLNGKKLIEIGWDEDDALPYSLCLAKGGKMQTKARGNIVLADHGYTINEPLEGIVVGGKYHPKLGRKQLTQRGPDFETSPNHVGSASSAFNYLKEDVKPSIVLSREEEVWNPKLHLLDSDEFAKEFVIETENEGTSYVRFDNDNRTFFAKQVEDETFRSFVATYRIGNGTSGNVGAHSIKKLFMKERIDYGISGISNLISAKGGQDPETIENIRIRAPHAFRTQERAVVESDYTEILKRHPRVQGAIAKLRWTGSWYTMYIAIDRMGGLEVDDKFKEEIKLFLEKYSLAGYDLEIRGPLYVPLSISLDVCVKKGYFAGHVKEELTRTFSNQIFNGNRKGFFHPDNFTFGQPLYKSTVYKAAMEVDGVSSIEITEFKRWGRTDNNEITYGVIKTDSLEIIRLDNDPNFAENGVIKFNVCGDG